MTSLRARIATLQRYDPEAALNVGDVYRFMRLERPVSLNDLAAKLGALPESVPFHSNIVTGTALGGEVSVTLNRNGSYRFQGHMRASGALSFSFRVSAVVRSASGQVTVAAQHSGNVFGTDTPGDRQNDWNELVTDPSKTGVIRELWPDISGGSLAVSRSSELGGVLGTTLDIVKDVAEFFVVAETFGASLAICVVIGSELGDAGVDVPGLGGVVGLGIVAGSLFIWGPLAFGPAFILGVAAGAIVDSMVKIRHLRPDEETFVRAVFGDTLDFTKIRLTNLVGISDRPFTVPTVDGHILVNIGVSDEMFDAPTTNATPGKKTAGQLLIHEMTHAWQIQNAVLERAYVPGYLCEGIREQVFIGQAAYNYGRPGTPWRSLHLEAQAHIVDEWYAGTGAQKPPEPLPDTKMNPNSPYFGYITNNIRAGSVLA